MSRLNWKIVTLSLGLHCAVSFVLCVAWGLLASPALHAAQLLEMVLPGFRWLSPASFLLGLVFTAIYNRVLKGFEPVR